MAVLLSLVEHLLNVKDVEVINCDMSELKIKNIIILDVIPKTTNICPICGRICPGYDYSSEKPRQWRANDWNGTQVMLRYRPRRITCPEHKVITEAVPWAYRKSHFTCDFENTILWLSLATSRLSVSRLMRIDWHTIDRCIERFLSRETGMTDTSRFDGLRHIAIDETSYQKRHKYITCVLNLDTNEIVWVGKGHGLSVIKKFFEQLTPEQRSSIKTVSGDGASWIDASVTMYVPHAKRCADPFHVILWCSAMLDSVRLRASRELKKNGKKTKAKEVKGAQIALGKDPSDLSEKQKAKIDLIAQECPELYQAYKAKEELRHIMKEAPEAAKLALNDWCERMKNSDIKELQELEKKISRHYQNICNAIQYGKNSARLEAINNGIKLIIRKSYGFRNTENLANHVRFSWARVPVELIHHSHHAMMAA